MPAFLPPLALVHIGGVNSRVPYIKGLVGGGRRGTMEMAVPPHHSHNGALNGRPSCLLLLSLATVQAGTRGVLVGSDTSYVSPTLTPSPNLPHPIPLTKASPRSSRYIPLPFPLPSQICTKINGDKPFVYNKQQGSSLTACHQREGNMVAWPLTMGKGGWVQDLTSSFPVVLCTYSYCQIVILGTPLIKDILE